MNQIELHTTIDKILRGRTEAVQRDVVSTLVNVNDDAKEYFFSRADGKWLNWLWKYGFLDAIKEKARDPNSYRFRMPELSYLLKMTSKNPGIVAMIICSFKISSKNFNPEVIDQFTRICSKLPAINLKEVMRKIRDERWVELMGQYTQYGFEYADMLEKLHKAEDFENILVIAEVVLMTRSKKDLDEKKKTYRDDNIFYINELSETKIFDYLVDLPNKYLEKALSILSETLSEVIDDEGDYLLSDEDLFTMSISTVDRSSYREEYKFLVATIIGLTKKLFGDNKTDCKKIYEKYFSKLPKNRLSRRLRLFVLSLKPELFIGELKSEYFRLFTVEKPMELLYGAEYERSLKAGISFLSDKQRRDYIKGVFALFGKSKDENDKSWKSHYGSCILSTISEHLSPEEFKQADKYGFKIDPDYEPEPTIGKTTGGTVTPRSPLRDEDFSALPVKDIAIKLKDELSPEQLQKYKNDDFLNPRDADGVAAQLKNDIEDRVGSYIDSASLFFDRNTLIPHYTNAFLRGVKDALAENRNNYVNLSFEELINLILMIKESGTAEPFDKNDKESEGRWLSSWNSVHSTIADLIEELIKQKDKKTLLNFKLYRDRILEILTYLLSFNDPVPEDEKQKTAKMTVKSANESEYSISDPFTIAINSVRGRAFQVLLHFVYQDASYFDGTKLADDVKDLYGRILANENTRAMMFMFGHYLPSFYFRDMNWIRDQFTEIFEAEYKDNYLKLAAWEGYLSNNLYRELFFEPYIQNLYSMNISLNSLYPNQKFFKNPHESISVHFALAFIHYEEFGFDHKLFKKFLKEASSKHMSEFISFIGRSYIAGENYNVLKDDKFSWRIERIEEFWDMILKTRGGDPLLKKFGTWIAEDNNVFDITWLADHINQTLLSTRGDLEWDYGLTKSIERLAKEAPKETISILEKHFLFTIENQQNIYPVYEDKEWYSAFKILYENKDRKIHKDTYNLINKLIEIGGKPFWDLENIVKGTSK